MIVDTSAMVAIHEAEPERARFRDLISSTPTRISASTLVEMFVVIDRRLLRPRLDPLDLLEELQIQIVPFDLAQARVARAAYRRYGRGSGSPARLNFGDCFSYALSSVSGEPLLFKGEDFTHTDVLPAI